MLYGLTALVLLVSLQQPTAEVGSGPLPAPNPISWEFEFKFLEPKRLEVQLPGRGRPETYWYMVYTVTNNSDTTQRFYPTFQLVTEHLRVIDTDMGISKLVFDAIKERHRQTHPYLVHPTEAIGDLRCGDDHARESVAIWRGVDLKVNRFTIYVAGLSGEARIEPNPAYDPDRPETKKTIGADGRERQVVVNPKHFTLRKTLEMRYTLPGSPRSRGRADPERQCVRWIMR